MTELKEIPRHKGHWFWGGTFDFQRNPAEFVLRGHEKYGDVFVTRVLTGDSIFVRDPDVVNAINVTHAKHFYKPKLVKRMWFPFLGNGLVPNDGDFWKRQHKLIRPGFHKLRIDAYGKVMSNYTRRMLSEWSGGEERDFRNEITKLALAVVGKTLFDANVEDQTITIREALVDISEALIEHAQMPVPVPRWWPSARNKRKVAAIAAMDGAAHKLIENRRADQRDRGDLLSHMVFATDEQGGMSNKQLRDELMTLIFAGHETTAHTLTWVWYLMAKNPKATEAARQEVDEVLQGRQVDVDDLPNLPYLEQVIKESLRLIPAVWIFGREAQTDLVLNGYKIPKGKSVAISQYALGRNPKYFEAPLEFRPERWTRAFERQLPKGAYVPFAAGPRVCLGKQFAMMEMKIVMATVLQHVDINVPADFEPDFVPELSLHPGERGMPMTVQFRHGQAPTYIKPPSTMPPPLAAVG